jgi:hypothetical protein
MDAPALTKKQRRTKSPPERKDVNDVDTNASSKNSSTNANLYKLQLHIAMALDPT